MCQVRNVHYISATCSNNDTDCNGLSFYMQNISKFLTPHTELHFNSGMYYLDEPLIFNNALDFSFTGENNVYIECHNASIVIRNSMSIGISNIKLVVCGIIIILLLKLCFMKIFMLL